MSDTIFALSSGAVPSGVAVLRISGPRCFDGLELLGLANLSPRVMGLRNIVSTLDQEILDRGLICIFPGPNSFTGEDCAELHVHGGRAVVSRMLEELSGIDGFRMADAGEFSRRAFENGKLDLTEIEGLGDLISADTELQRKQAVVQAGGKFRAELERWREEIIRCRAYLEAEFDFSDEDDVPDTMREYIGQHVDSMIDDIEAHLDNGRSGEIIRDGYRVVLTGAPNSGKSSLMNALAGRDIAIVNRQAGTTRDVLECSIDLDGYLVTVIDTAGIRETDDEVEAEGINRAVKQADMGDLAIWLSSADNPIDPDSKIIDPVVVVSKSDLLDDSDIDLAVSTRGEAGIATFMSFVRERIESAVSSGGNNLITRERHRVELECCRVSLVKSNTYLNTNPVLCGEELRVASDCIGRLTGFIDVEDLLDVIFSEFCVGK